MQSKANADKEKRSSSMVSIQPQQQNPVVITPQKEAGKDASPGILKVVKTKSTQPLTLSKPVVMLSTKAERIKAVPILPAGGTPSNQSSGPIIIQAPTQDSNQKTGLPQPILIQSKPSQQTVNMPQPVIIQSGLSNDSSSPPMLLQVRQNKSQGQIELVPLQIISSPQNSSTNSSKSAKQQQPVVLQLPQFIANSSNLQQQQTVTIGSPQSLVKMQGTKRKLQTSSSDIVTSISKLPKIEPLEEVVLPQSTLNTEVETLTLSTATNLFTGTSLLTANSLADLASEHGLGSVSANPQIDVITSNTGGLPSSSSLPEVSGLTMETHDLVGTSVLQGFDDIFGNIHLQVRNYPYQLKLIELIDFGDKVMF